jgi:hypothetical protein
LFQQDGEAQGGGDAAQNMRQAVGAKRFGETGETQPLGTQPHGDKQYLAAVDDPAERAGKAPGARRRLPSPIGIGIGW